MSQALLIPDAASLPPVPWRDPHVVSPGELKAYITQLEEACLAHPESADLRTCLGMAYAVDYDVYKSMDALEAAVAADPEHFWSQMKYAELHYRLRLLPRAEEETLKALVLARNPFELTVARSQLRTIKRLLREGTRTVTWNKPLTAPALVFVAMLVAVCVLMVWQ